MRSAARKLALRSPRAPRSSGISDLVERRVLSVRRKLSNCSATVSLDDPPVCEDATAVGVRRADRSATALGAGGSTSLGLCCLTSLTSLEVLFAFSF